ncbi:MAG: hypothetical protein ACM37W_04275 [Actinomycetota bacterium]
MAIIDEWRMLRQQRQRELRERKLQVQSTITSLQQERLAQSLQDRRGRQAFVSRLHSTTQKFLRDTNSRQRAEAQTLAQQLDEFARSLSVQTAEFLTQAATERKLAALRLDQELQNFQDTLKAAIAASRQERQARLKMIQSETQEFLATSQLQRLLAHSELSQKLAKAVATLRSDIQSYLQELELMRESRAQQLQQAFQQNRTQRQMSMQALRDRFANFRTQLQEYRQNLQREVWGDSQPQPVNTLDVVPVLKAQTKAPVVTPAPISKGFAPVTVPKAKTTVAIVPANRPVAPAIAVTEAPPKAEPPQPKPVIPDAAALQEQKIYDYIRNSKGARLTEIESALAINRVQTVDALRSLLTKGLITQSGRVYAILEANSQN